MGAYAWISEHDDCSRLGQAIDSLLLSFKSLEERSRIELLALGAAQLIMVKEKMHFQVLFFAEVQFFIAPSAVRLQLLQYNFLFFHQNFLEEFLGLISTHVLRNPSKHTHTGFKAILSSFHFF